MHHPLATRSKSHAGNACWEVHSSAPLGSARNAPFRPGAQAARAVRSQGAWRRPQSGSGVTGWMPMRWLVVHPIVAGRGPRLLDGIGEKLELELVERWEFASGLRCSGTGSARRRVRAVRGGDGSRGATGVGGGVSCAVGAVRAGICSQMSTAFPRLPIIDLALGDCRGGRGGRQSGVREVGDPRPRSPRSPFGCSRPHADGPPGR